MTKAFNMPYSITISYKTIYINNPEQLLYVTREDGLLNVVPLLALIEGR
jgi:hypothetical protein